MGSEHHKKKSTLVKAMQILSFLGFVYLSFLLTGCGENSEDNKVRKKGGKSALTIIRTDDCLNCHSIEDKSVGPAYLQVAQKYEADFTTVNRLADKIIEGGGGLWGSDQMSKHPFLKKADARKVVQWILSLRDTTINKNPMTHAPGITLSAIFQQNDDAEKLQNGLTMRAYSPEQLGDAFSNDFPEVPQNTVPLYSGLVKGIHLTQHENFQPLQENFLLRITGFFQIKQKGKYFFKLVKTGQGRVFLNQEVIINENTWDSEIVIDLEPGTYPITVEYLTTQKNNALSLQWIPPNDEYYSVVPEEVLLLTH